MTQGPRAWQTVLSRVESDLLEGRLRPGERLPPERELAAQLGVSRPSVREALRVLEVMGLVRTATGSGPAAGAIIVARPAGGMATLLRLQTAAQAFELPDVVSTRILLEGSVVRTLAERSEGGEEMSTLLAAPREVLAAMGSVDLTSAEFLALDARFHLALAEASGNTVMVAIMAGLRGAIENYFQTGAAVIEDWPVTAARLHAEHDGILAAIAAGDAEAAQQRTQTHISGYFDQIRG